MPKRILLVEDDEDSALLLAETFQDQGYRVEVARDGLSALQTAAEFRPEICVLDVGLPDIDGYEVARRLRQAEGPGKRAYLIALTGYGRDDDRARSMEAGFDVHFVKPVHPDVLSRALAEANSSCADTTRNLRTGTDRHGPSHRPT